MNPPKPAATRQFAALVLAPVDPAKLGALRSRLAAIGAETAASMKGHAPADPIIPFSKLETVHYSRLVLVDVHDGATPLLAFSTDFDGPEGEDACPRRRALDLHIEELARVAGPGLESVFECCTGFQRGQLATFLRRHQKKARTFYVGASGRSRNQILWEAELRRKVDVSVDKAAGSMRSPEDVRRAVRDDLAAAGVEIPPFPPQPDLTGKVRVALLAVMLVVVAIAAAVVALAGWIGLLVTVLLALLLVLRFRHLERTDPQFQPEYSAATVKQFSEASASENEFFQNQLTHVVSIKPGPIRWLLIRAVFAALDLLARDQYNKGKLGGIPSIHFARWAIIPNRTVLFFSNFDSSWQSYLGDFIDQASAGLTGVWSNTVLYPHTTWLLRAGSRDAGRFLAWTRHFQQPTQVWYSAYPGLSIVNINSNTEIRRGLASDAAIDATSWLFRLRGVDRLSADQLFGDERREPPLPVEDVQGIILWGYGHMPEARFLLFRVAKAGRELSDWISTLPLTPASGSKTDEPPAPLVNIAFTYRGLLALGVEPSLCSRFSTPFVQGSDDPYRARVNGDVGDDAPEKWRWGSAENPVDLVLLVYAENTARVESFARQFADAGVARGLTLVASLEGTTLPGRKEHFGFRDGIAQPMIRGSGRGEVVGNTVDPGEFLLGHRDGYGNLSHSPESSAGFAFGTNGSYLVFRQLEQDVGAFWRYCAGQPGADAVTIASKLVGRWPSGASLVRHPDADPASPRFADEDDFSYLSNDEDNDRYGARCPFGSHIRRTNPRDWQLGEAPKPSLELANLHRILRRGRPYGPPFDASMAANDLIGRANAAAAGSDLSRGLQFLCFNTYIDRQFEFIQQQWCNNPKFAGQNADADPLLGMHQSAAEMATDAPAFTLQSDVATSLSPRLTHLQRFVRVVGSAYFFMPSIPAVRLLPACCAPAAPQLEMVPPDEQLHIDSLVNTLRNKMKRDYAGGRTLRDAHPKMHGCVHALFTVEPNLAPELRVGIFRAPGTCKCWMRFSNAAGAVGPDKEKDIRGVGIKLLGVPSIKLLEGEEDCRTHDLLLISAPTFVVGDVAAFDKFVSAMVRGRLSFLAFLLSHPRVAVSVFNSAGRYSSPLEIQYFSVTPYLFGSRAVKYSLRPVETTRTPFPSSPSPDFLREAMATRLATQSVRFDLLVQFWKDERTTPVEDPRVTWPTAFVKVATLEVLQQTFDTPERREFADNLSFNPWRCLPEHRPLGGLSRARRQVYRALSAYRHNRNAAAEVEPGTW